MATKTKKSRANPRNANPHAAHWPADSVKSVPIGSLHHFAGNPRTHSPEQVAQIAASMSEWGWTNPIMIDETGRILAGHGRLLAAQSLGWKIVPVITARGWSEAKKKAYVIADNRLGENAGWDREALRDFFTDLKAADFEVELTGYDLAEIDDLFSTEKEPDTEQTTAGATAEYRIKVTSEFLLACQRYLQKQAAAAPRSEAAKLLKQVVEYLED